MKKASIKKIISIFLLLIMTIVALTGCNFSFKIGNEKPLEDVFGNNLNENKDENQNENENVSYTQDVWYTSVSKTSFTVAELKDKYAENGNGSSNSEYMFKPFYNVEQTTEFTFKFNSNVEPMKAVTVHTDSKCELNSMVYQWNDGYKTANGVDVIVKPYSYAPLSTEDREDYTKEEIWGYAPIYYLCVRYDLDSKDVKKLDKPIVIPFTVKNEIDTPTVYADIDENGTFSIKWLPVAGAKSYKIYHASLRLAEGVNRAEYGYVGDFLHLKKTVDASVNQYLPVSSDYPEGLYKDSDGYVRRQNNIEGGLYYVSAVDAFGNESFFGKCATTMQYESVLPYDTNLISSDVKELTDTVSVISLDKKTELIYPINYYRNEEPWERNEYFDSYCEYRYEIPGTKLTGYVRYYSKDDNYPIQKISNYVRKTGGLEKPKVADTIPVNVDTMSDEKYSNSKVDLGKKIDYPKEAWLKIDPAILVVRTDIEMARKMSGKYHDDYTLDTIKTYLLSDDPEWILTRHGDGVIEVVRADKYKEEHPEEQKPEVSKPEVSKPQETTPEKEEVPEEINNDNYVEEQRKSTEEQVEKADQEVIKGTQFPIWADDAAQEYLVLQLINQEEKISLKAFPKYQDKYELLDDLLYLWYQNPYIMGFDISNIKYDFETQTLFMDYNVPKSKAEIYQKEVYKKSKEVVKEIIKPGMTNQEKVVAIWDYLEKNAEYNNDAIEYADSGAKDFYKVYSNCWNTYGILCEKKGVCQSYAYAFKILAYESGLESVMVIGTMFNGGHAWSAVKLNNMWYMVDTTNNAKNSGMPYWVCNSSTEFIYKNGFVMDDRFVDGVDFSVYMKNDNKQDWYYVNGLAPETVKECVDIWMKERINSDKVAFKYQLNSNAEVDQFMNEFIKEAFARGVKKEEFEDLELLPGAGIIVIQKEAK